MPLAAGLGDTPCTTLVAFSGLRPLSPLPVTPLPLFAHP